MTEETEEEMTEVCYTLPTSFPTLSQAQADPMWNDVQVTMTPSGDATVTISQTMTVTADMLEVAEFDGPAALGRALAGRLTPKAHYLAKIIEHKIYVERNS